MPQIPTVVESQADVCLISYLRELSLKQRANVICLREKSTFPDLSPVDEGRCTLINFHLLRLSDG